MTFLKKSMSPIINPYLEVSVDLCDISIVLEIEILKDRTRCTFIIIKNLAI